MHWQYTPYIIPLLITAILTASLVLFVWKRRYVYGATSLILLMLAVFLWSIGNVLELVSIELSVKLFWVKIEYFGIVSVPVMWLAFILQYTGREKWLNRRNIILLMIIPLVTIIMIWTNDLHGLMRYNIKLDANGPFPVVVKTYGIWFWVFVTYTYILIFLGSFMLLQRLFRPPYLYRGQVVALLICVITPWIANILYVFHLNPIPPLDLTPPAFAISGLAMIWGFLYFRLLEIMPVARGAVIECMSDGVIVVDVQNRIVDMNPAAQSIIGIAISNVIGQPVVQILSKWPDLVKKIKDETEGQTEIILTVNRVRHYYDFHIIPLSNRHRSLIGRLITLCDITDRKRAKENLEKTVEELKEALNKIKKLSGMLPICASCKKIRDDEGYWNEVESYIKEHSEVEFTHSICPVCMKKLYPGYANDKKQDQKG